MSSAIGQVKARETQPAAVTPELIRTMFQTIDKCDWNGLQHVFCEDMTYERPGYEPFIGYELVQQFYRKDRVIASGEHLLEKIVINQDCGACWGRFVGMNKNGSPIDERFADVYTFENGKVKTRRSYFFRPVI
jgi:ketosteroid isomerase-like protein